MYSSFSLWFQLKSSAISVESTAMAEQIQSLEDNKMSVPSYIIFLFMFFLAFLVMKCIMSQDLDGSTRGL